MSGAPWWRGQRGEWYVIVQMVLFVLVAVGPRAWRGWPSWPLPDSTLISLVGLALLAAGGGLAGAGVAKLGSRLTPLPYPVPGGSFSETGAYRVVRHPMYCGAVLAAFGWAIVSRGGLTLVYSVLLFLLFDLKARREEGWLLERFPAYGEYRRRVRKLIPFVY